MQNLHFIVGISGIFAFIGTGQYMHIALNELRDMDDASRMLYRSAHIYILLAAFMNILLSVAEIKIPYRWIERFTAILCLAMPGVMTLEFFYGPKTIEAHRDLVFFSVLGILVCSAFLAFTKLVMKRFYSEL